MDFTHLDDSNYNALKTKAPYNVRLRGNTWSSAGKKAEMPELDGEAMRNAFHDCEERMSKCVGEIKGSFETGTPNLGMSIFDYYAYKRGSNRYNHHDFKLPFPSGDNACREKAEKC